VFGKNIPIKPVYESRDALEVISLFHTIQGEGPLAGAPAIFLRLAGCNLRCHFCDTEFTVGARTRKIADLVQEVEFLAGEKTWLVVLTGGEPLAQPITPLVAQLVGRGFHVQIETAGTVWQSGLEAFVTRDELTIVCSPKTTSVHKMVETYCEDYKYIIRSGETDPLDGLPARSTQDPDKPVRIFRPHDENSQIWVQPCDEYLEYPKTLDPADRMKLSDLRAMERDMDLFKRNVAHTVDVALAHGYRISFQLHKVLGVE
jgi:7-carboxy-7-deazaguanine synthase